MSNTKQPPQELAEKMKEIQKLTFHNHLSIDLSAEQCAQIAVQHAEEIQKSKDHELSIERYKTEIMNEAYEKAKEENRELREALKECAEYLPYIQKQRFRELLNKNEYGKE